MISRKNIEKIGQSLKRGDQKAIAEDSGLSVVTVNRFFNGNDDLVSDEASVLIVQSASKIIKKRSKIKMATEKLINSI